MKISLLLLSCFALSSYGASSITKEIQLANLGNATVKVFKQSIRPQGELQSAIIFEDLNVSANGVTMTIPAQSKIRFSENTLRSVYPENASVSVQNLTTTGPIEWMTFYSNGNVHKVSSEYLSGAQATISTAKGQFICSLDQGKNVVLHENGAIEQCLLVSEASVALNNGTPLTVNYLELFETGALKTAQVTQGVLETQCSNGSGAAYSNTGKYFFNEQEKVRAAYFDERVEVNYQGIIQESFQMKARDCELKGYTSFTVNQASVNGLRVIKDDDQWANTDLDIKLCNFLGYETWSRGGDYGPEFLGQDEDFYEIKTDRVVTIKAGKSANVFKSVGCAGYGEIL